MNRKLFVLTAIMTMAYGFVQADMYSVPSANTDQPADVNYGGVKVSTSAASVQRSTVSVSGGVVYGAFFSTGTSLDYAEVCDSTATSNIGDCYRIYNVGNSTGGFAATSSGFSTTGYPRRHKKGIIWRPSTTGYTSLDLYYWKPD